MAVNPVKTKQEVTVEDDVVEIASLLGATFRSLKATGPPPPELREAVERASLGDRHWPALLTVALAGPLSISELAERLGLRLSTTSTIAGQLSRAGLLNRNEDEDDRRRTIVCLHADYRKTTDAWLDERVLTPIRETLERLSPQARVHFMDGWRILQEELSARTASLDETDCDD